MFLNVLTIPASNIVKTFLNILIYIYIHILYLYIVLSVHFLFSIRTNQPEAY